MIWFLVIIIQLVALAALAAGAPLHDFCSTFNGKDCQIVWQAPTNGLPTTIKIQKVVPAKFSSAAISNLLQLVGLSQTNRMLPTEDGVFSERNALRFSNRKQTRYLGFAPSTGLIAFSKEEVVAQGRDTPVNVPNDVQTLKLALALLPVVGIKESELATKPDGKGFELRYAEGSRIMKDKTSGEVITNVIDRSIFLTRQIENIPVWGPAGISAKFGNDGKLAHLEVIWRAVKPDKDCPVPTASEFVNRIKSGRVLVRNEQAGTSIKKLTIEKVRFYYWEDDGSERQEKIYPFAVLETKTDQAAEDARVQLFVPLTQSL